MQATLLHVLQIPTQAMLGMLVGISGCELILFSFILGELYIINQQYIIYCNYLKASIIGI